LGPGSHSHHLRGLPFEASSTSAIMSLSAAVHSQAQAPLDDVCAPKFGLAQLANLLLVAQSLTKCGGQVQTDYDPSSKKKKKQFSVQGGDGSDSDETFTSGDESTVAGASSCGGRDRASSECTLSDVETLTDIDVDIMQADEPEEFHAAHLHDIAHRFARIFEDEFVAGDEGDEECMGSGLVAPGDEAAKLQMCNFRSVGQRLAGLFEDAEDASDEEGDEPIDVRQWTAVCERIASSKAWAEADMDEDELVGINRWQDVGRRLAQSDAWGEAGAEEEP